MECMTLTIANVMYNYTDAEIEVSSGMEEITVK